MRPKLFLLSNIIIAYLSVSRGVTQLSSSFRIGFFINLLISNHPLIKKKSLINWILSWMNLCIYLEHFYRAFWWSQPSASTHEDEKNKSTIKPNHYKAEQSAITSPNTKAPSWGGFFSTAAIMTWSRIHKASGPSRGIYVTRASAGPWGAKGPLGPCSPRGLKLPHSDMQSLFLPVLCATSLSPLGGAHTWERHLPCNLVLKGFERERKGVLRYPLMRYQYWVHF